MEELRTCDMPLDVWMENLLGNLSKVNKLNKKYAFVF